ncbi:MAG: outer membrane beta-barrel protein, partial [Bacteroidota bacterium]
ISLNTLEDETGNPLIFGRYFYRDNWAVRLGFGLNSNSRDNSSVDSLGNSQVSVDSTISKTDIYISPGFEYHLVGSRRLDPYIGVTATLGLLGSTNVDISRATTDTTGVATLVVDSTRGGGSALGINIITGFNFFVSERLSIGAEYSFGYNWLREGGDYTSNIIEQPISGSQIVTNRRGSDVTTNQGFEVRSTAGITLSYFFARPPRRKKRADTAS